MKSGLVLASWSPSHTSWSKRQQLNVVNSSPVTLHTNTPIAISIDTKTLVSQKLLNNDCSDLRILYQPNDTTHTELTRHLVFPGNSTCSTSSSTKVYFNLQTDLTTTSTSTNYYLYYGNRTATPPTNTDAAFNMGSSTALLVCPFNGSTTCAAGETPSTQTGAIRYGGASSALSFDGVNDTVGTGYTGEAMSTFTAEAWVYNTRRPSGTNSMQFISVKIPSYNLIRVQINSSGTLTIKDTNTGTSFTAGTLPLQQWTHLSLTYSSGTMNLYVNGINGGSSSSFASSYIVSGVIFSEPAGGQEAISGMIDEHRFSNIIRYTTNFTPSTSPFVRDEYTKLLYHFDENGDDPRYTGKAIDDSGNGNNGTITGAKYVSGVIGIDSGSGPGMTGLTTGSQTSGSYSSHEGVMIEEGTTNKITNPSFENTTAFNTNWTPTDGTENFNATSSSFTPSLSKRTPPAGPFATGVMVQGKADGSGIGDILTFPSTPNVSGIFNQNLDGNQGSMVFWITPEWNGNDGVQHDIFYLNHLQIAKDASSRLMLYVAGAPITYVDASGWTAGTTYNVVARWNINNYVGGSYYTSLTVNGVLTTGSTTKPSTPYMDGPYAIGSRNDGVYPANALIQGFTIYRRPLYDGTTGTNVGNGDEISQIYAAGVGKDPTLVTGSWDVVFALPTNSTPGTLATGTGNAWSHPHSSNLLYTSSTNTGGFMMNGTYTSDGWVDEGTPTTVSSLATANKIYAGGYYITSNASNQGISYTKALTSGSSYVIRALGNSDGTCSPQVLVTRADGTTEITHLNGTTTSTRTSPDSYIFTFQAPATENGIFKLINLASTGTCSWHQIEVLPNLVSNPSIETGAGDPWIPTGWSNYNLTSTQSVQSSTSHSGSSAVNMVLPSNYQRFIYQPISGTVGKYYTEGAWTKNNGGVAYAAVDGSQLLKFQSSLNSFISVSLPSSSSVWSLFKVVGRATGGPFHNWIYSCCQAGSNFFVDDYYTFQLSDVSLTTTPATLANSTETSGIRVDGADTLTQPITNLSASSGTIEFKFTPRHSISVVNKFGATYPAIFQMQNGALGNDSIALHYESGVIRLESYFNGVARSVNWSSPTLNAGTTYTIKVFYSSTGNLELWVDGAQKASVAMSGAAFSVVPTTMYFGGWYGFADRNYDATFTSATYTSPTVTANTTSPYVKFGNTSTKIVATDATNYVTSINPASTATHTLSAYVYDGTTGNIGGVVDSKVASIVWEGVTKATTYTDMGGGWWRLSYSSTTTNSANNYGVHIADGKTIYLDGVQLEEKIVNNLGYVTSYTDGSLGSGYAWTGEANNSTSTRATSALEYSKTGNIDTTKGTVSLWFKPNFDQNSLDLGTSPSYAARYIFNTGSHINAFNHTNIYFNKTQIVFKITDNFGNSLYTTHTVGWTRGQWINLVMAWDNSTKTITSYVNNSILTNTNNSFVMAGFGTSLIFGNSGSGSVSLPGVSISNYSVYNSPLTSTQVSDLYYSGLMSRQETGQTISVDRFDTNKGQNPVAIYHMDEGRGTSTNDSSTYLNHLTNISGATWTVNPNYTSLKFDGVNDYVSRPFDPDFNFSSSPFTITGLFKHPSNISGTDTILSRQSGSTGYKVYMNSSGYLCFLVNSDSTCTTTSVADSLWHHFETVRDTSTLTIYIDGVQSSQVTGLTPATVNGNNTLYLGIDTDGVSNPWDGYLDEIYIYPTARTASQVLTDFNGGQTGVNIGKRTEDNLTEGLVGWWKMDETSWNGTSGEVVDSSGNGNNGTAVNGATTAVGKYGNGGAFDTSAKRVSITETFNMRNNFTYSVWLKKNTCAASDHFIGQTSGKWLDLAGDNFGGGCRVNAAVRYSDWSSNWIFSSVVTGVWYHYVVTVDTKNIKMYVNGDLSGTISMGGKTLGAETSSFYLGSGDHIIDDARVYNRALSPNEVAQLYEYAPGPVAHWKMDEGTGQSVYDSSGNGNTGTWQGTLGNQWSQGKFGKAGKLNGNDNYINVGNGSSLNISNTITVEGWVRINTFAVPQGGYIPLVRYGTGMTRWDLLAYSGGLHLRSWSFNTIDTPVGSAIPINGWTHIAFTYDSGGGSNNVKGYINGVLGSAATRTGTLGDGTLQTLLLGDSNERHGYFNGSIDDVRIYNYARTQKQIVADMLGTGQTVTAGGGIPSSSKLSAPIAYYKFDEGAGTVANNSGSGGNALNGTFGSSTASPTWTNNGKFGKALSFDGGDYVGVPTNSALNFNGSSFSFGGWFKTNDTSAGYILAKYTPSATYQLSTNTVANKISFYLRDASVVGTGFVNSTTNISTQTWYHALVVVDKVLNIASLYVNGKLENTVSVASLTDISPAASLVIGAQTTVPVAPFNGSIDEVKIYNYALSLDEVKQDYNQGSSLKLGSVSTEPSWWLAGGVNPSNVVAAYQSIGAASYASSKINLANPGTYNATDGTAYPTWDATNGWTFTAASSQYLDTGVIPPNDVPNQTTWSFIIKYSDAVSGATTVFGNSTNVLQGVSVIPNYYGQNKYVNGYNATTGVPHASGVVAIAKNKAYFNGVDEGFTIATYQTMPSRSLYLGGNNTGGGLGYAYGGKIQAFAVYNTTLSAEQVKAISNSMAGITPTGLTTGIVSSNSSASSYCVPGGASYCAPPVAEWNFDEGTGSTVSDTSGNGNTGTWQGTLGNQWSPGKFGKAGNFKETNNKVYAGTNAIITNLPNGDYSASLWFKIPVLDSGGSNLFHGLLLKSQWMLDLDWIGGSGYRFWFWQGMSTQAVDYRTNYISLLPNVWYQASLVYSNSTKTVKIYLNNQELTYSAAISGIGTYTGDSGGNMTLGYRSATFIGLLDQVRIYNYARTPAQIAWDYNRGMPIGWWKMDECNGTVLHDSSGNNLNGTLTIGATGTQTSAGSCSDGLTTSSWFNGKTGKQSSSLNFDGVDDTATITNGSLLSSLQGSSTWSTSFWTKRSSYASGQSAFSIHNNDVNGSASFALYPFSTANGNGVTIWYNGENIIDQNDGNIADNSFHLFTFVSESSTSHKLYVDGKLTASSTVSKTLNNTLAGVSIASWRGADQYFPGQIDDVRIYSYPLTPLQVKDIYNGGAVRFGN